MRLLDLIRADPDAPVSACALDWKLDQQIAAFTPNVRDMQSTVLDKHARNRDLLHSVPGLDLGQLLGVDETIVNLTLDQHGVANPPRNDDGVEETKDW